MHNSSFFVAIEEKLRLLNVGAPQDSGQKTDYSEQSQPVEEEKELTSNADCFVSNIKERSEDPVIEDEDEQPEQPKKMSKFKMRQMQNKHK